MSTEDPKWEGDPLMDGTLYQYNAISGRTQAVSMRKPRVYVVLLPMTLLILYTIWLYFGVIPAPNTLFGGLVLVAFLGLTGALIALGWTYKIGANETEIYYKPLLGCSKKSIRVKDVKAVFVVHFERMNSNHHPVQCTKALLLHQDGTLFAIENSEKFMRPLVDFLHQLFPSSIEEGYNPSQFETSHFSQLFDKSSKARGEDGSPSVDQSLLDTTYRWGAVQIPTTVVFATAAFLFLPASSSLVVALVILLLAVALCGLHMSIFTFSLLAFQVPSRRFRVPTNMSIPIVSSALQVTAISVLCIGLVVTWDEWTQHWLQPFIIFVIGFLSFILVAAIANLHTYFKLRSAIAQSSTAHMTTPMATAPNSLLV